MRTSTANIDPASPARVFTVFINTTKPTGWFGSMRCIAWSFLTWSRKASLNSPHQSLIIDSDLRLSPWFTESHFLRERVVRIFGGSSRRFSGNSTVIKTGRKLMANCAKNYGLKNTLSCVSNGGLPKWRISLPQLACIFWFCGGGGAISLRHSTPPHLHPPTTSRWTMLLLQIIVQTCQ